MIVVGDDGHTSTYHIPELYANLYENYKTNVQNTDISLWDKKEISDSAYARVPFTSLADTRLQKNILQSLVKYGVAFIDEVPANIESTQVAIRKLFAVHKTFFGEMWSFSDKPQFSDSAYTNEQLNAHTDNTYFNDASGLQILHCVGHKGTGGKSLLVDGFNVLKKLKAHKPDVYERLCKINVTAEYIGDKQHHVHCAPMIRLNPITQLPEQIR